MQYVPHFVPALAAMAGGALIAGAPFLTGLPEKDALFLAMGMLWALAVTGWVMYGKRAAIPMDSRRRSWIVMALFTLTALPLDNTNRNLLLTQWLALAGLFLCMAGLIRWTPGHRFFARVNQTIGRALAVPPQLFIGALYIAFLALTVFLSWYCFAFLPTIIDTISQYVHAKFMAAGALYAPSHPLRGFFNAGLMINNGKWYSQYQPLHVMLLALGHMVNAPWLVNPLAGALTLVATYLLARRVTDEATARLSALLVLCSPFVLFMSSEYMNHATSLLFTTLLALCYVAALQAENKKTALGWALAAGFCLGAVFLIRPLTALAVGLPFIAYSLTLLWRDPKAMFRLFLVMSLGGVACLLFQLWYNMQTTGDPFLFPYAQHHLTNVPGFNKGHTLWKGINEAHRVWLKLNVMLFEGCVPGGVFLMLALLLPLQNRYLRLLLGLVVSVTLVNMVNRYHSFLFGPRYIYEATSAVLIFTAIGMRRMPELLAAWRVRLPASNIVHGISAVLLIAVFILGWSERMPAEMRAYTNNYVDGNPKVYFSLLEQAKPPALVFIGLVKRTGRYNFAQYLYVAHTNPPRDDAPVIFALDRGEKNRKLIDYYPGRNVYLEREGRLTPIDRNSLLPQEIPVDEP